MATVADIIAGRLCADSNPKRRRLAGVPIPVIEEIVFQAITTAAQLLPEPAADAIDDEYEVCIGCEELVSVDDVIDLGEPHCPKCAKHDQDSALADLGSEVFRALGWTLDAARSWLAKITHAALSEPIGTPESDRWWEEDATRWPAFVEAARRLDLERIQKAE